MFNYHAPEVQDALSSMQQQATKAQEINDRIKQAVGVVQKGAWLGESETNFNTDVARLQASMDQLHAGMAQFIANLNQASAFVQEAAGSINTTVGGLP